MLNYILYRIGQFFALRLPLRLAYKIAVFLCNLRYPFARADRKYVRANLEAIFPEKSYTEIRRIRRAVFRNFAKYLVDFFRLCRLDKEYIDKNIRLENLHYLDEALSRGRGVIALSIHIGNWELAGVTTALLGYPIWAVALSHRHRKVNEFFNSQRQAKGLKVIPIGRAVRQCLSLLNNNAMVALLGDRNIAGRGLAMEFLGRVTLLPIGPASFSLKTGAPIVPGFMLRQKDDKFILRFEQPIELLPSGNTQKDVSSLIKKYKVVMERYIRQYPEQWYMFRKFWV
jgi:KDO2-lipid IV(A) lauroyltransferase